VVSVELGPERGGCGLAGVVICGGAEEKMTMSARVSAMRAALVRCSRESPTMVLKATTTPRSLRPSVRKRELVSCRYGVSISEPAAMISAIMYVVRMR